MFTIHISAADDKNFVGLVKEIPMMGQLKATTPAELIQRYKQEINFLIKDRPDLQPAIIQIETD